jgi:membrane-associated phospholipid phosphatase
MTIHEPPVVSEPTAPPQTPEPVPAPLRAEIAPTPTRRRRARLFQAYVIAATIALAALSVSAASVNYFPLDLPVARGIQSVDAPWFAALMTAVSAPGFAPQSYIVVAIAAAALSWTGLRWEAVTVVFAGLGSGALATGVKLLVHRPRPSADLVRVISELTTFSFPSGHVVFYTAFFGLLLFLAFTLLKPSLRRTATIGTFGALVVLVGPSRIYLGHHWPSDVVGAYLFGSLWLALTVYFYRWGKSRVFAEAPAPAPAGPPPPVVDFWTLPRRLALMASLAAALLVFLLWLPAGARAALFRAVYSQRALVIMLALLALVALSLLWSAGQRLDARLFLLVNLQRRLPVWLDWVVWLLTQPGHMLVGIAGAAVLYVFGYRVLGVEIAVGTLTLALVVEMVKAMVNRRRPFLVVQGARVVGWKERGQSFPSGHTAQAFLLATLLVHRFEPDPWGAAGLYALALLVGFTRMYLGAHYPRDVLAGAMLGSIWGLMAALVDQAWLGTGG